jgi:hypothetical protein
MQLSLFQGQHLPLTRARTALEQGDLRAAYEAFANACALAEADSTHASERLAALEHALRRSGDASPEAVHTAFAAAFENAEPTARDPIPPAEWFRFYAAHLAQALAPEPARRFRGWRGLHFELAVGRTQAALGAARALVSSTPVAWAWLEAARAAHAAGDSAQARRWVLMACLAREALVPDPPRLTPAGRPALDAPGFALPSLPAGAAELWKDALELDLPGPACAWVPAIGLIDGIFALAELRSPEVARVAGLDTQRPGAAEPASQAFLRALVAAREARARGPHSGPGCGAAELHARAAMKRSAPLLFERYMARLGLGL